MTDSLVPFERFAKCLSDSLVLFERSATCLSDSLVLFVRFSSPCEILQSFLSGLLPVGQIL